MTDTAREMICPFCGEDGFDAIGLKGHLENEDCDDYRFTPVRQRMFTRTPAPLTVGESPTINQSLIVAPAGKNSLLVAQVAEFDEAAEWDSHKQHFKIHPETKTTDLPGGSPWGRWESWLARARLAHADRAADRERIALLRLERDIILGHLTAVISALDKTEEAVWPKCCEEAYYFLEDRALAGKTQGEG